MAGRRTVGVVVTAPGARRAAHHAEVRPSTVVRRGEGGVPTVVPPQDPPEATRFGPKPLSLRRRPVVLALTLSGWTPSQIAEKLHVTAESVRQTQYELRKAGQLNEEVALCVDKRLVPRAIENLTTLLEAGDKDATFETLKGRGVFRKDIAVQSESRVMEFRVNFDVPTDGVHASVIPGQIVATPNAD